MKFVTTIVDRYRGNVRIQFEPTKPGSKIISVRVCVQETIILELEMDRYALVNYLAHLHKKANEI